jgi:hypothetical protein
MFRRPTLHILNTSRLKFRHTANINASMQRICIAFGAYVYRLTSLSSLEYQQFRILVWNHWEILYHFDQFES